MRDTRAGKIIFLDDELGAVQPYITQLRDEGFTNIVPLQKVATLNELSRMATSSAWLPCSSRVLRSRPRSASLTTVDSSSRRAAANKSSAAPALANNEIDKSHIKTNDFFNLFM